tara:strand:- start:410 stop:559 length:150 start_codon:yes stop_codon:yes gene_type:complete
VSLPCWSRISIFVPSLLKAIPNGFCEVTKETLPSKLTPDERLKAVVKSY